MTMTAEQLEEMARGASPHDAGLDREDVVEALARRVIAAEKLAYTVDKLLRVQSHKAIPWDRERLTARTALTAYREASK